MNLSRKAILPVLLSSLCFIMHAESGAEGWLRYAPISAENAWRAYLPINIVVLDRDGMEENAAKELQRGLSQMLGRKETFMAVSQSSIVLGTGASFKDKRALAPEAFRIEQNGNQLRIEGGTPRGVLYGAFRLLQQVATESTPHLPVEESPSSSVRWVNQWDNLDGTIERGYAGRSIFFENGHVRADLSRVYEYARLLASVGINGVTINNVNSDLRTLTPQMLQEIARVADVCRPWGVRISLSIDLSSPKAIGGLSTFDPLDAQVIAWWKKKVDDIYQRMPDFGGFVVKADSEGRPGPSQYGRSPADAANVLARPLQQHGGLVLYRGFVYNHHLDWNDRKADRARAGYDNFRMLDGRFEKNVIVQVKHGPIDFQVREPVSPLIAALQHTSQAIELQITQEYTGQQRHMVFLVPMWKWVLDTDMQANGHRTLVSGIVEGKAFHQPYGGFVGVANVGLDANWLHHPMAMANLYGFGRLAWDPQLSSLQIVDEWTRQTWENSSQVVSTINALQLQSWKNYEDYTGPLGVGGLTDIIGVHYGPGIESAERNGWGQWIRADRNGIGMDRTVATGTGYIGQYPSGLAATYESLATCPDNLLLFMHHVPYTHRLHSGKTVVQHVYDSHYAGADAVAEYVEQWATLRGQVDTQRWEQVNGLFQYQAGHAIVWRDAVTKWFETMSGIVDEKGRVGHYPGRIEAEIMQSQGYKTVAVTPWETASAGKAVVCAAAPCSLAATVQQANGRYNIAVQYFDLRSGVSHFTLLLNNKAIANWAADDMLPPAVDDPHLDGHTSTRYVVPSISLNTGDTLQIQALPAKGEPAPIDYIEITPAGGPSHEN